jgi:O-antigen ligase
MADAVNASRIRFDRARLERVADWLAVAVAVSLPWSTSATAILVVVWLLALVPTLDVAALGREIRSPAGGLPVALWAFAALGMLWADAAFAERVAGLGGFHKLLIIPLLLAQFRRSERGALVLYGFLISCLVLLVASWSLHAIFHATQYNPFPYRMPGLPARDYIAQSAEFLICAFALLAAAIARARAGERMIAAGLALLAALFIANILYIATGRTALVVIALLLVILAFREFSWKGMAAVCLAGAILVGLAWASSPFLRQRVTQSFDELRSYSSENAVSSSGLRLEFWKKSFAFIAQAPVIGNGTGSMPGLFRRAAIGESGAAGVTSVNPHNQFFGVAIQLGLVGGAILIAMWLAHLALFRGAGLVAWIGFVMVAQNVVSSLFNSHLFDFFHGWLYVFGVGVIGGMVLRARANAPPARTVEP